MATAAAPGFNPAYLQDPSLYGDQQSIDQQRQIAQLLLSQGLTPPGNSEVIGGVAIRRSPMEGAAKLAQVLSGQSINNNANQASQGLMQRQTAALMGLTAPGGQPVGPSPSAQALGLGGGPTNANAATMNSLPPQQISAPGPLNIPGMDPRGAAYALMSDPSEYYKTFLGAHAPTDMTKLAMAAGSDPAAANAGKIAKDNYIAPVDAKVGTPVLDPITLQPKFFAPQTDKGIGLNFGNDPLHPTAYQIPGYAGAASAIKAAETGATGRAQAENEMTSVALPNGQTQMMTKAQALDYANGSQASNPGIKFTIAPGTEGDVRQRIIDGGDYKALAAFDKQVGGGSRMPGFTSGQSTADAEAAKKSGALPQESMEARFGALRDQNATAETTNSYLQNIKALAPKAATGQFSDREAYINSLLSLAGSDKATDAASANDLLNKYSNQIVARLGQGGLGTDAARSILASAYPNSHMQPAAIAEAADNLMGANAMTQAKARLLAPVFNQRDTRGYQEKEQAFDQNADPRIWQYANIQDPAARRAFLQNTIKSDPNFLQKAQKLHDLGAL